MNYIRLWLIGVLLSTVCCIQSDSPVIDTCLFAEPGMYAVKDILSNSIENTMSSAEWREKKNRRLQEKVWCCLKYVLFPLVCTMAVYLKVDDKETASLGLIPVLWGIKKWWSTTSEMNQRSEREDLCELQIQMLADLKKEHGDIAQTMFSFYTRREESPRATGKDKGLHSAAKLGLNVENINGQMREELAQGPADYWKRCDNKA